MATSDSDSPSGGARLPPPDIYDESSPSGEVLLRRTTHAMGDSSNREVVNLSKEEYLDLIGEVRSLRNQLSDTKHRRQLSHSRSQSRERSPEGRNSHLLQGRSDGARPLDHTNNSEEVEKCSVYNTPRASVVRSELPDHSNRRSGHDAPISGHNRASFFGRRDTYRDREYGHPDEQWAMREPRRSASEDVHLPRKTETARYV